LWAAEQAAEKLDAEGGGGFNPCKEPAKWVPASAAEGLFLSQSPEIQSFSAAGETGSRAFGSLHLRLSIALFGAMSAMQIINQCWRTIEVVGGAWPYWPSFTEDWKATPTPHIFIFKTL
jgi:hypothetical protein